MNAKPRRALLIGLIGLSGLLLLADQVFGPVIEKAFPVAALARKGLALLPAFAGLMIYLWPARASAEALQGDPRSLLRLGIMLAAVTLAAGLGAYFSSSSRVRRSTC